MTVPRERGRFAPTPSGALHVGSARTAVASALAAWSVGGDWVLRVEDLDHARTAPGATAAMLDDLRWLGLTWDEGPDVGGAYGPYLQSERAGLYEDALRSLQSKGLAYPCACSRRDVELASSAPHGREPVYPGTCRGLDPEEVRAQARARGRGISWRFRVPDPVFIEVEDRVLGASTHHVAEETGDFVIYRSDGVAAYQLAVVVDDLAMRITEVVRGADLLDSTARQVLLYRAFDATPPRWAHLPLVLDGEGARLAKRSGAMGIAALRASGVSARDLRRWLLASLGIEGDALREAAKRFDVARLPREEVRWTRDAMPRGARA